MNIFFTADEHHFANCMVFFGRPYKTVESQSDGIISNSNKMVKPDDLLYHAGDYAIEITDAGVKRGEGIKGNYKDVLARTNGEHIFVMGNHDWKNRLPYKNHRVVLKIAGILINVVHDPFDGNVNFPINIHGHLHNNPGSWKVKVIDRDGKKSLFINVGVDQWNYHPVKWSQIQKIYDRFRAGHDVEKEYNDQSTVENK